jgi:hypothetical protein
MKRQRRGYFMGPLCGRAAKILFHRMRVGGYLTARAVWLGNEISAGGRKKNGGTTKRAWPEINCRSHLHDCERTNARGNQEKAKGRP